MNRQEMLDRFLETNDLGVVKLEFEDDELQIYFSDSTEPWSIQEFEMGSRTRAILEALESLIWVEEDEEEIE